MTPKTSHRQPAAKTENSFKDNQVKHSLHNQAMSLLQECNYELDGYPQLDTINSLLSSVVKELNGILINSIVGKK